MRRTGPIPASFLAQAKIEVPAEGEVQAAELALKSIRKEDPKPEPPAKEKPTAENPDEKPADKPAEKPAAPAAAPRKDPLQGKEAAERVKQFPPLFSKPQDGLEIGIAIASDHKTFHLGERVPLELVIRNVSPKSLVVQHSLYPPETPPTVIGKDGKPIAIEEIILLGSNRRYRDILKPNEAAVYRHMGLGLGEKPNPPGTFWHPLLKNADAVPGKYRLSQQLHISVREEGRDDGGTGFRAVTGEVEFEIALVDPKKGAEVPAEKPVEKPAEKQVESPAEKPADKSAKFNPKIVIVRGKAIDDETGKPIAKKFVQGGMIDRDDPTKVSWGYFEHRSGVTDGYFDANVKWVPGGWTCRIVADGYVSQPVLDAAPPDDKDVIEVTIRLKRGRTVRGVVLDHMGKPLKDAAVFAIGLGMLNVAAGQALSDTAKPTRTDERGRFELPAGDAKSLAVSHPKLDVWPAEIPENGDVMVRLPEPARVEINLDIDGADKESNIYYELIVGQMPDFRARSNGVLRCDRNVPIANPGKLVLDGMTPGKYQLSRRPGRMLENDMFELKPGEVKTINFVRPKGARVRGKLTWPADIELHGITITITGGPLRKSPFFEYEWATTYAALSPAKDGTFLTERIPPGIYELAAYAYEPAAGNDALLSGLSVPTYHAQLNIDVPASGELKVPDLVLKSGRVGK